MKPNMRIAFTHQTTTAEATDDLTRPDDITMLVEDDGVMGYIWKPKDAHEIMHRVNFYTQAIKLLERCFLWSGLDGDGIDNPLYEDIKKFLNVVKLDRLDVSEEEERDYDARHNHSRA